MVSRERPFTQAHPEPRTEAGKAFVKEFGGFFAVWPDVSFIERIMAIEDEAAEAQYRAHFQRPKVDVCATCGVPIAEHPLTDACAQ